MLHDAGPPDHAGADGGQIGVAAGVGQLLQQPVFELGFGNLYMLAAFSCCCCCLIYLFACFEINYMRGKIILASILSFLCG